MIRNSIPIAFAITVLMLLPFNAKAVLYHLDPTDQNGTEGALGFGVNLMGDGTPATSPTLGLVGWFAWGVGGGGNQAIYGQGGGSLFDYACYGLTVSGNTTCTDAGKTQIWNPSTVVFSGSVDDNLSFLDLSWTGQSGSEVPFGFQSLFISSINSGSYDASGNISGGVDAGAGYDADGFSCWNNPLNGLPGPPDFCGNGTGVTTTVPPGGGQTKANRELPAGLTGVTDNGDGTFTIDMTDSTYSDCIADAGCTPGSNSSDVFAQWRLCGFDPNGFCSATVPVPGAIWLFGSALGLIGWLRRKTG
jgi:hypothetical protein